METVKVNEDSILAYPEIADGAGAWVYRDEPDRPITVSANGLKALLQLVGDCWPIAAGVAFGATKPDAKPGPYTEAVQPEYLGPVLNRLSAIWCEGDLIVSGLFIDEQGRVVVNSIETGGEPTEGTRND